MSTRRLIGALDVGTSKICFLLGEKKDSTLAALGLGMVPAQGLRKGLIVNIEEAARGIREARREAEAQAYEEVSGVITGVAGSHIESQLSTGVIALKEGEVREEEVERVLEAARAVTLPPDRIILHVLPQEYSVDHQTGILQPLGMTGVRLEVKALLVKASGSAVQNLVKTIETAGLSVFGVVLQVLASAEAVLTEEEKELGVALIDFGGGTTDLAVFLEGSLRYTSSIPVGGDLLTTDLTVGLRTPRREAEILKEKYGVCLPELVSPDEEIEVPSLGDRAPRRLSRRVLAEILEPRVQELLEIINTNLEHSGYKRRLSSGVVFTGGSSLLSGLPELAEQILELPVRVGYPARLSGLSEEVNHPRLATAVGLFLYAARYLDLPPEEPSEEAGLLRRLKKFLGLGG
ncbi:cell division protein FtsA [Thermosulfurimonas marina]|uniref:Cell division protein FtsA n=1 Tax=Thermosulfurimonas marina TaxID=2047767 RepID=A0A6H1WRH1_9BACT|nr:cell division protein FtsA [Thermosulfurimonas marina]QJA05754.1 cell division protein FtsA [Thermosulfurimonas marina]